MAHRLRRLARLLLACAGVVIGILAAEAISRVFDLAPRVSRIRPGIPKSSFELSDNPILGYQLKRGYRSDQVDNHEVFAYINDHGQRDIERTVAKPAGRRRIIVLGDSVVAGHGIDLEMTISRQLEMLLTGRDIEVLNFGVGGYCTRAEVELLETKALAFSPDLVILIFVYNDFDDLNSQIDKYRFRHPAAVEWLFLHSFLFRRLGLAFNLFHLQDEFLAGGVRRWHQRALGEKSPRSNVERGLERLARLSEQHRFATLIGVWPVFAGPAITDLGPSPYGLREFNGEDVLAVETLAGSFRLPIFRFSDLFREDYRKFDRDRGATPQHLYAPDRMHPSEKGARVAAEILLKKLEETGFLALPRGDS